MRRRAMPPLFMITPARTKNGMARREKELIPRKRRWAETIDPPSSPRTETAARTEDSPTATLIGAPRRIRPKMPTTRMVAASAATSMWFRLLR